MKPAARDWRASAARLIKSNRRRPLAFEPNVGQTDACVRYLTRGPGYTLFLTKRDAVFAFAAPAAPMPRVPAMNPSAPVAAPKPAAPGTTLRIALEGANQSPVLDGVGRERGITNYIIGRDPSRWHTQVPNYARVVYRSVYPGIDLTYYGNTGALETDFTVAPGADPSAIRLNVEGAERLERDRGGDAVIRMRGGALNLRRPLAYQEKDGRRIELAASYRLIGSAVIGIEVAGYDHSRPLIIDPVIALSGFIGGSNEDAANALALDANYNIYLAGLTNSPNFPPSGGGPTGGESQAFVTMMGADGGMIFYTTFIGGTAGTTVATGLAVDSLRESYVAGLTFSSDFPATTGTFKGFEDAFVAKLNSSGVPKWATLMGGATAANQFVGAATLATAVAISPTCAHDCTPYITGQTTTTDFPINNEFQDANGGSSDPFDAIVAELTSDGTATVYSSFLGGSGGEYGAAIAVDTGGNAYVTGITDAAAGSSNLFPVTGGVVQGTFGGGSDAFAVKVNSGGSKNYATFLGGTGYDIGLGIAVDTAGDAYVAGQTYSDDFPVTIAGTPGFASGFVTKLNSTASAKIYSRLLGGSGANALVAIALDTAGEAFVSGITTFTDYPVANQVESAPSPMGALYEGTGGVITLSSLPQSAGSLDALAIDEPPALIHSPKAVISSSTIYAGTLTGLWISTDAGTSFHASPDANVSNTAILFHSIGLDRSVSPADVWVGTFGGLFMSTDQGQSFAASPIANGTTPVVVDNNSSPAHIYAGSFTGGVQTLMLSTDGGATFGATGMPAHTKALDVATAPGSSVDVFLATNHGILSSTDGAASFAQTNVNWPTVFSLAVDPFVEPYRVIAGENANGVVTSTDGFASFLFPLTVGGGQSVAVAVNPSSGNAHATQQLGDVGFFWKSTDEGATFHLDPDTLAAGFEGTFPAITHFDEDTSTGIGYASLGLNADPVVTELSADGTTLTFSSYLGGSNWDVAHAVATDPNGDAVWLAGGTFSTTAEGFPISSNTGGGSGIQSDNAGHEDAYAAEIAFSATPTGIVTAPAAGNVNGSPGQTVTAGSFTITNNYPVAERLTDIKITVADPGEFSSMTLSCAGPAPFSATVTPPVATTVFPTQQLPDTTAVVFPNEVYTCTLSATISNTPALRASAVGLGGMFAGMTRPPRDSGMSGRWGGGALAIGAVLLFAAMMLAMPRLAAARTAFALAALLMLATTQISCDPCPACTGGASPTPTAPPPPTATATRTPTATPTPPPLVSDQQLQAIDAAVDALGTGVTFSPLNLGNIDLGTVTVI